MGNFLSGMATAALLGLMVWFLEGKVSKGPHIDTAGPVFWRDSMDMQHARVGTLEAERVGLFLDLAYRDSLLRDLQTEVRRYRKALEKGGSATVVEAVTGVDTVVVTDTVHVGTVRGSPVYEADFDLGNWVSGRIRAGRDSTAVSLRVRNAYTVVVGTEKRGLFGKRIPYAEVVNRNPYTETVALRAMSVSMPRGRRLFLGPMAGLGWNGRPFVGVGIGYGLWGR